MRKITCDVQDGDEQWVDDFVKDLYTLCGMVREMFVENKVMLLSPVLRQVIVDKGKAVEEKLAKARNRRMYFDNIGPPLKD